MNEVTVRLDDLRLLLQKAEPLLVSPATANDPVVWAIDRLGDALLEAELGRPPRNRRSSDAS